MKVNEVFNRWHQDEDTIWSQDQAMKLAVGVRSFLEDERDRLPKDLVMTLQSAFRQLHLYSKYPDDEEDKGTEDWYHETR